MRIGFRLIRLCPAYACAAVLAAANGWCEELPSTFDVEMFDVTEIEAAAVAGRPCELHFCGDDHKVLLEPVDLRSYRFEASVSSAAERSRTVYKPPPRTFKGTLLSDPDSVVRLGVTKHGVRGYVRTDAGWTFIRPMPPAAALVEGEHMVFTDADLGPSVVGTCSLERRAPAVYQPLTAPTSAPDPAEEPGPFELAVEADMEYFLRYGAGSVAEIEAVLNEVDGIFTADLGLTIEIVHVNVWQDATQPYTSTDPDVLLDQLQSYWNLNMGAVGRDTVHLMTGKDLDGNTVGLAYLDAVCNIPIAYGLTQDVVPPSLVPIIVAHELGHNLGSGHDVDTSVPRYIMYPSISGANLSQYSTDSKSQIGGYLGTVSCVTPAEGVLSTGGGGGGGSGGPVDPLLLMVLAAALTYKRARDAHAEDD